MSKPLIVLLLALAALPAFSGEATPAAANVALEKRVTALAEELRCLVCQNQTIADSHAGLAVDLKNQIREKLASGMSEREIIDYMVERYGDFVLYRPPVKTATVLLWFGPLLLLVLGLWFFTRAILRRGAQPPLSTDEQTRARALLGNPDNKNP